MTVQKVGLEVEFIGPVQEVIEAMRTAGLSNRMGRSSYMGHENDQWIIKSDSSVCRDDGDTNYDFSGGEMVSPPLDFNDPDARAQFTRAVNVLKDAGCYPNDSTGVHVHVDVSDLSVKQLVAVVKNFYKFEDVLYRIASSGHRQFRSGGYRFAPKVPTEMMNKIARATTMGQLREAWYGRDASYSSSHGHQSRYRGVNLHSYFYRGTIEFRIFNGSVNADRIQTYIALCVALIEDARRGKSRSINRRFALGEMLDGTTNASNAFHRFQQVVRYDAGMSLDDMKMLTKVWNDSVPQRANCAGGA